MKSQKVQNSPDRRQNLVYLKQVTNCLLRDQSGLEKCFVLFCFVFFLITFKNLYLTSKKRRLSIKSKFLAYFIHPWWNWCSCEFCSSRNLILVAVIFTHTQFAHCHLLGAYWIFWVWGCRAWTWGGRRGFAEDASGDVALNPVRKVFRGQMWELRRYQRF